MSTTQPIRNLKDLRALTGYYLEKGQHRNHRLIMFGLHSALRISDILHLRWHDVYDFKQKCVRETFAVTELKTGKRKIVAINAELAAVLESAASVCASDEFLFVNPRCGKPISRIQAYRIIRAVGEALGFPLQVSCHSLRKTFGYHAWKNGASPAVIMEIFNHSSIAHTRRYLGVTQDDINEVYMGFNP